MGTGILDIIVASDEPTPTSARFAESDILTAAANGSNLAILNQSGDPLSIYDELLIKLNDKYAIEEANTPAPHAPILSNDKDWLLRIDALTIYPVWPSGSIFAGRRRRGVSHISTHAETAPNINLDAGLSSPLWEIYPYRPIF